MTSRSRAAPPVETMTSDGLYDLAWSSPEPLTAMDRSRGLQLCGMAHFGDARGGLVERALFGLAFERAVTSAGLAHASSLEAALQLPTGTTDSLDLLAQQLRDRPPDPLSLAVLQPHDRVRVGQVLGERKPQDRLYLYQQHAHSLASLVAQQAALLDLATRVGPQLGGASMEVAVLRRALTWALLWRLTPVRVLKTGVTVPLCNLTLDDLGEWLFGASATRAAVRPLPPRMRAVVGQLNETARRYLGASWRPIRETFVFHLSTKREPDPPSSEPGDDSMPLPTGGSRAPRGHDCPDAPALVREARRADDRSMDAAIDAHLLNCESCFEDYASARTEWEFEDVIARAGDAKGATPEASTGGGGHRLIAIRACPAEARIVRRAALSEVPRLPVFSSWKLSVVLRGQAGEVREHVSAEDFLRHVLGPRRATLAVGVQRLDVLVDGQRAGGVAFAPPTHGSLRELLVGQVRRYRAPAEAMLDEVSVEGAKVAGRARVDLVIVCSDALVGEVMAVRPSLAVAGCAIVTASEAADPTQRAGILRAHACAGEVEFGG